MTTTRAAYGPTAGVLPGEWADEGLCRGSGVNFYSEDPRNVARAKSICASCPVQEPCLNHAMHNEPWGVWGGMTATERRDLAQMGATQFCLYGHPLSGDNLYVRPTNGARSCRTCMRDRKNAWKARQSDQTDDARETA